jgi:hypothetical protein
MKSFFEDMSATAEDFKKIAGDLLAEVNNATTSEQQAVAGMYDDMVSSLKMTANDVKTAFQYFQEDVGDI